MSAQRIRQVPHFRAVALQMLTSDVDVSSMFIKRWLRDRWDEFDYGTRTRLTAAALVPGSIYSRAMRGRVLVRNPGGQNKEGKLGPLTIVVEFDDFETAQRFYSSGAYTEARLLREDCSQTDLVLVEGV